MKHLSRSGLSLLLIPVLALAGCQTLPLGKVGGWKQVGEAMTYSPITIFNLIDGEAELFMPYGFESAETVEYASTAESGVTVDVETYTMASPLGAFGIYSTYRYPDADLVPIGTEGYIAATQLVFYKDRYFVKLTAKGSPSATDLLKDLAGKIARDLPGNTRPPAELALINVPGVAANTARYIPESLLGYAFFPKGLTAETADGTASVLVVFFDTAKDARSGLGTYESYLMENKAKFAEATEGDTTRVTTTDPLYKGTVLETAGRYLVGVNKQERAEDGLALLAALRQHALAAPGN